MVVVGMRRPAGSGSEGESEQEQDGGAHTAMLRAAIKRTVKNRLKRG
jgi:hypothetical protein